MTVRPAASSAPRSVAYAPTRSRAIVPLPSSSAPCVRTSATGVRNNAARMIWITASAAPNRAVDAPKLAARWLVELNHLSTTNGKSCNEDYAERCRWK